MTVQKQQISVKNQQLASNRSFPCPFCRQPLTINDLNNSLTKTKTIHTKLSNAEDEKNNELSIIQLSLTRAINRHQKEIDMKLVEKNANDLDLIATTDTNNTNSNSTNINESHSSIIQRQEAHSINQFEIEYPSYPNSVSQLPLDIQQYVKNVQKKHLDYMNKKMVIENK